MIKLSFLDLHTNMCTHTHTHSYLKVSVCQYRDEWSAGHNMICETIKETDRVRERGERCLNVAERSSVTWVWAKEKLICQRDWTVCVCDRERRSRRTWVVFPAGLEFECWFSGQTSVMYTSAGKKAINVWTESHSKETTHVSVKNEASASDVIKGWNMSAARAQPLKVLFSSFFVTTK